tara:strand:+ start:388 stop:600 length:213 start_codon:yes stop_codon:yes gene_type:complete
MIRLKSERKKEIKYVGTVKVTREYSVGFESPCIMQAYKDLKKILETEHFRDDYDDEELWITSIKAANDKN